MAVFPNLMHLASSHITVNIIATNPPCSAKQLCKQELGIGILMSSLQAVLHISHVYIPLIDITTVLEQSYGGTLVAPFLHTFGDPSIPYLELGKSPGDETKLARIITYHNTAMPAFVDESTHVRTSMHGRPIINTNHFA